MRVLSEIEPKEVFAYFEDICEIPHPSDKEEKLSNYCVDFAKKHHLTYYEDELHSVILIKEATPGYEDEPAVILQGHLDMVCEKEPGCTIDFDNDGLDLMVEGDYISAKGTTLGGDDGIAVAYALAILASDQIAHPRLEVILTASEEVGLNGAREIDVSMLQGRRLINLDSEEEGILLSGCAGGASVTCTLPVKRIKASGCAYTIKLDGMIGGHSGVEIHKGRANANLVMGRVLMTLSRNVSYYLADFAGGKKDNAIPRDCSAGIYLAPEDEEKAKQVITQLQQSLSHEYALVDPDIKITLEKDTSVNPQMLDEDSTRRAVMLVNMLPNGVQTMSADVEGLVETSLNLGVLKLEETELAIHYAARSSVGSAKDALLDKLVYLTESIGGTTHIAGVYPAWEYKRDSKLREKMIDVYEKMYGKKPLVEAIHAGVECGLLAAKLPGLDCISIGPDMQSVHTTEEKLSISSTKRVWEYLLEVLKTK